MSSGRVRKESKFLRYMKGPIKILARARDFYVRNITDCAGAAHVTYGNAMGCPAPQLASLPRSFSTNSYSSRDDDLRELIRIASTRSLTRKVEAEVHRLQTLSPAAVPRSRTVTVGRIDEDKPCEFGGEDVGGRPESYPRSRSYAASTRSNMV